MTTYKIIESKSWKNKVTGKTASIYGSVPYFNDIDAGDWEIVTNGYTLHNTKTGIVGIGRKPFKTYDEAETHLKSYNDRMKQYAKV